MVGIERTYKRNILIQNHATFYLPDNDRGKDPYKYPIESTDSDTGNNGGSCKPKSDWNLLGKLGLNNPGVSAGSSLQ